MRRPWVLWLLHQHRTAYELWDHELGDLIRFPDGLDVREAIRTADRLLMKEAKAIFTISRNVTRRLTTASGLDSTPLYHPPKDAHLFYCADDDGYFYFPSRLSQTKRQKLVIQASAYTKHPVRVLFAGVADTPSYAEELKALSQKLGVASRIHWLGHVSEEEKRRLYAHATAVLYPPVDEDFGYVTLEAMLASKAVITCADSGGPLEFVRPQETGVITEPTPEAFATALDLLWSNRAMARAMGQAGKNVIDGMNITWSEVVKCLLS